MPFRFPSFPNRFSPISPPRGGFFQQAMSLRKPSQTIGQHGPQFGLAVLTTPRSLDGVCDDGLPVGHGQVEGVLDGAEVVEHVGAAAEVGRVVAVEAEADAGVQVGAQGQLGEVVDAAQRQVRHGTHGDEDAAVDEFAHQGRRVVQFDAVVHPDHAEVV